MLQIKMKCNALQRVRSKLSVVSIADGVAGCCSTPKFPHCDDNKNGKNKADKIGRSVMPFWTVH